MVVVVECPRDLALAVRHVLAGKKSTQSHYDDLVMGLVVVVVLKVVVLLLAVVGCHPIINKKPETPRRFLTVWPHWSFIWGKSRTCQRRRFSSVFTEYNLDPRNGNARAIDAFLCLALAKRIPLVCNSRTFPGPRVSSADRNSHHSDLLSVVCSLCSAHAASCREGKFSRLKMSVSPSATVQLRIQPDD